MNKEITMTFNQFFEMERGDLTLDEIVKTNDIERIAGKILKNNKLRRTTITVIALTNMTMVAYANENVYELMQVIKAPKLLEIIGCVCIIYLTMELCKNIITRKGADIGHIIIKYIIIFIGASSIPWVFELIRSAVTS